MSQEDIELVRVGGHSACFLVTRTLQAIRSSLRASVDHILRGFKVWAHICTLDGLFLAHNLRLTRGGGQVRSQMLCGQTPTDRNSNSSTSYQLCSWRSKYEPYDVQVINHRRKHVAHRFTPLGNTAVYTPASTLEDTFKRRSVGNLDRRQAMDLTWLERAILHSIERLSANNHSTKRAYSNCFRSPTLL